MNIQLAILVSCAFGSSQIAIPIHRWHGGQPYVNTTIPAIAGDRIIEMGLTAYSSLASNRVPFFFTDRNRWAENITVHVGRAKSFYSQYVFGTVSDQPVDDYRGYFGRLGIGRGSPLVREYGSVDFIKSLGGPASMIVNSTMDWFTNIACIGNSVISAPYNVTPYSNMLRVQVGLGFSALTSMDFVFTADAFLMSIPIEHFATLTWIIRAANATLSAEAGKLVFEGCSRIRPRLPNLRIVVDDHEILLTPQDYTEAMTEGDQCGLLVRPSASRNEHAINPFLLPDMNVRFTNSTFYICESNVTSSTRLE